MKPTGAGDRRKYLTIMRETAGNPDPNFNQPTLKPVAVGSYWAAIEPVGGRELWQGQHVEADTTHVIRFPWDPALSLTSRDYGVLTLEGNRRFNFVSVLNRDERNIEYLIQAREV